MIKFRLRRMKRLAKILQEHHDNGKLFNMAEWLHDYRKGDGLGRPHGKEANWCGTSACALGLAALDPVFNKQGLRRVDDSITFSPRKKAYAPYGIDAGATFFGIYRNVAEFLFLPNQYSMPAEAITTQHVLHRVQHLIKHNGLPPRSYRRRYPSWYTVQERA